MAKMNSDFLPVLSSYFSDYLPVTKGLSTNTIRSYQYAFLLLFEFLNDAYDIPPYRINFSDVEKGTIEQYLAWLEENRHCSISSRNQRLSAVSAFAAYAIKQKPIEALGFYTAVTSIPAKKKAERLPIYLSTNEVSILLKTPDGHTKASSRDRVLMSVLYASGARAQELCDLTVGDIRFDEKTSIKLIGKGRKGRVVTIPKNCARLLKSYIESVGLTGKPERHVFSSQTHEHMTISCVEGIMKKYIKHAKAQNPGLFLEKHYTPHSLRHSIAVHMLEAGIPLPVIKNFLGHSSIETTMIYATVSDDLVNKYLKNRSIINEIIQEDDAKLHLHEIGLEFLNNVAKK
ncbi:MAG: tyrosine-type recombinase/integrase [Clostridia bacterium]